MRLKRAVPTSVIVSVTVWVVLSGCSRDNGATKNVSDEAIKTYLSDLPLSDTAIGAYTQNDTVALGIRPRDRTIFSLLFMKVVQKVEDGYLLQWAPPGEAPNGEFVYLRTDINLPEDFVFLSNDFWAVSMGAYQYRALNGFERKILAFALLNKKPSSQPRMLQNVDRDVVRILMER